MYVFFVVKHLNFLKNVFLNNYENIFDTDKKRLGGITLEIIFFFITSFLFNIFLRFFKVGNTFNRTKAIYCIYQ